MQSEAGPAQIPAGQASRQRKERADRVLDVALPIAALLAIFVFWQFFVVWRAIPRFIFPQLTDTLTTLRDQWGDIWSGLQVTLEEASIGFVIGNVLAIIGASIFIHSRFVERTFFPVAVVIQTIPIVVWSPILVIVFPSGSLLPQIAISVLISFFPALVNMTRGLRDVDPLLLELCHVLNATRWQVYRKLRWPAAIPTLFATLRITSTLSLIGAIVGEYVAGGGQGVGYELITARASFNLELVMAITLVTSVTGVVVFLVVAALERVVLARRGQAS